MKPISDFPDYFVDKQGNVWSKRTGKGTKNGELRKLKPIKIGKGYLIVNLYKNKQQHKKYIHRLILETFVEPCPPGMECCHKNGIGTDNKLKNLRWDTSSNNTVDMIKHGNRFQPDNKGENNGRSKLIDSDVIKIKELLEEGQLTQEEIGKIFGVERTAITKISTGKHWRHIK